jgi:hypothetical protein
LIVGLAPFFSRDQVYNVDLALASKTSKPIHQSSVLYLSIKLCSSEAQCTTMDSHPVSEKADISETENGVVGRANGDVETANAVPRATAARFAHLDEAKILRKVRYE